LEKAVIAAAFFIFTFVESSFMIETVEFKGQIYPKFQTNGNAARFCMPFALELCKGHGVDVGCHKPEWAFPGAIMVDPSIDARYDAMNLPEGEFDYIFSSHCLEHLHDWVGVLNYWATKLKSGSVLFLYLPDYSQHYWRPWNNRKHVNVLSPEIIADYLQDTKQYRMFTVSQVDCYNSFIAYAQKA
jgi:SAM-dependent methyltransferase